MSCMVVFVFFLVIFSVICSAFLCIFITSSCKSLPAGYFKSVSLKHMFRCLEKGTRRAVDLFVPQSGCFVCNVTRYIEYYRIYDFYVKHYLFCIIQSNVLR